MAGQVIDIQQAKQIGLRRLTTKSRSVAELRRHLLDKQVTQPVADQVISRFIEVGLLDDTAFARSWVTTRQVGKSASQAVLRRELVEKGIDAAVISEVLAGDVLPDLEVAENLARRRVKTMLGLDPVIVTRRLSATLARRGFSPSVVRRVVHQVVAETTGEVGNIDGDE